MDSGGQLLGTGDSVTRFLAETGNDHRVGITDHASDLRDDDHPGFDVHDDQQKFRRPCDCVRLKEWDGHRNDGNERPQDGDQLPGPPDAQQSGGSEGTQQTG